MQPEPLDSTAPNMDAKPSRPKEETVNIRLDATSPDKYRESVAYLQGYCDGLYGLITLFMTAIFVYAVLRLYVAAK